MFRGRIRSIHFVGIGGIGMSGIAEVMLAHGFEVSGSDLANGETVQRLASLGAKILHGHHESHVERPDVVVYSSAIASKNPELVAARRMSIPVVPRAEMLAELMKNQVGIAVAGTHGKTTTTSLAATVLRAAELDPTVVIGGVLNTLGSNAARGLGDLLVAEADESDGSFLRLSPVLAIITNIDAEHLDHYGTHEAVKDAFVTFANQVPFYGLVIACLDHPEVRDILPRVDGRIATYGLSPDADYSARSVTADGLSTRFRVRRRGEELGGFELLMPGIHNVQNAMAVIALADELGVDMGVVREGLRTFGGVQRRFTVRGQVGGVTVVDDYGHHPTEIEVTLAAAQQAYDGRVVVAFQPHRFSRTQDQFEGLAQAFGQADLLFMTDVYAAGEARIEGADSVALCTAIQAHGHSDVTHVGRRAELVSALQKRLRPGDVVITLGAGNITLTGPELLSALTNSQDHGQDAS